MLRKPKNNETVIILGAGSSGLAATRLFLTRGLRVFLIDDAKEEKLSRLSSFELKGHPKLELRLGTNFLAIPQNCFALVLSPGISLFHPLVIKARDLSIPIVNEIDCALLFMEPKTIVGITGTNGKSTTTVMLENILKTAGFKVWAGGNLGQPLSDLVVNNDVADFSHIILELSSYQLETLKALKLDCAVILNITPDHLDRYSSMEHYIKAKLLIQQLIKPDGLLVIKDELRPLIDLNLHKLQVFNKETYEKIINIKEIKGEHNYENACAALLCAESLEIPLAIIKEGLRTFKPLPHRCEVVDKKNDILFINDSKGTTVDAVKKALNMTKGPVNLLLGGLSKGEDFYELGSDFFPEVASYHIYGDAQNKIAQDLKNSLCFCYEDLTQAFKGASQYAKPGYTILLSPGCASFDQYSDFNARGEHFRRLVQEIGQTDI